MGDLSPARKIFIERPGVGKNGGIHKKGIKEKDGNV